MSLSSAHAAMVWNIWIADSTYNNTVIDGGVRSRLKCSIRPQLDAMLLNVLQNVFTTGTSILLLVPFFIARIALTQSIICLFMSIFPIDTSFKSAITATKILLPEILHSLPQLLPEARWEDRTHSSIQ
jgi:hypothetical protein